MVTLPVPVDSTVALAAVTDITERKRFEQERTDMLKRAEAERLQIEQAEQRLREQQRLVDMICHEIRNPLHGILSNVDLLRERRDRPS